jgi:hypothetical protein
VAEARKSPGSVGTPVPGTTPPAEASAPALPGLSSNVFGQAVPDVGIIGSPMKRHRGSIYDNEPEDMKRFANFPPPMANVLGLAEAATAISNDQGIVKVEHEEEEL